MTSIIVCRNMSALCIVIYICQLQKSFPRNIKKYMVSILRSKIAETNFQNTLDGILREAMKINRAKLGNMQIINNQNNWLEIVAQRGFGSEFVEHFKFVTVDGGSICGRAMKSRETVFVDDVSADSDFLPHLQYAIDAGFRAVISTPFDFESREHYRCNLKSLQSSTSFYQRRISKVWKILLRCCR